MKSVVVLALALTGLLLASACGSGPADVVGFIPDEEQQPTEQDATVRFVDAARGAGIAFTHFNDVRTSVLPEDMGSGMAWGDYNGDGLSDLFIVNSSRDERGDDPADRGKLYRNLGDGTFRDVTEDSGIKQTGLGMGAIWFDYDGDGNIDLFITGYGWQKLFRNRGDETFEDVTDASGLAIDDGWPAGATVADYDLDGDLDLYVPHYIDFQYDAIPKVTDPSGQWGLEVPSTLNPLSYEPLPNAFYRNNGDGTFSEKSESAGVVNPDGRSLQAVFSDFNNDGLPDLFVANDTSPDMLFVNNGDGTFKNVSEYARTADARGSMGVAVGDYDGDLDWDIWVTHWVAQDDALFRNMSEDPTEDELRFVDKIASAVGESSLSYVGWGVGFLDFDNDGWLDVFVVNGSTFEEPGTGQKLEPMRNLLFRNRGDGTFVLANSVAGEAWETENVGRGASFADYDNDGDLDIFILARGEGVRLLQNQGGNSKNWLAVELRGPPGNRQAVGARVTLSAGGMTQARELTVGSSYLSMNDTRIHFGLGKNELVDWVEIRWPNGELQKLEGVNINQTLTVTQGGQ